MAGLSQDELKALVGMEMRQSLGYSSSKLSAARQKAEYYYLGLPVGTLSPPEVEGRSSVVSTDVRDTIESMLPQLMAIFCGGDTVVEFEPQLPGDEQKAQQITDYMNYLFFKKNEGFLRAYVWMKDALLQKNGIVKCWWDTRWEEKKEEYKGLDQVELATIMDDPEVEVTEQTSYSDEYDAKQRQDAISQLQQQLQQAAAQNPPPQAIQAAQSGDPRAVQAIAQGNQQKQQAMQQLQQQIAQIQAQPPVLLYDITCKRTKKGGKLSIENVPPEELLISRNAKSIQTAKFVGHRVQRTVSELKSMGYKNVDDISGEDQGQAVNSERIQRLSWNDENAYLSDEINTSDESQRLIWVTECYIRCDFDGDGISELRKVTVAGNELLDNEEIDYTPFASITPVPLPHTFFGLSVADLAIDSQTIKTSILRSQLDNLYLDVNGRYFAVDGQVNLDDLLSSRPGGVVRVKQPGAVGRLDQSSGDINYSLQMMEYMQQDLENKTGWSRQSMGNSATGLNTTATAANIVTNKADMRVDLIARHFAEGFTELFKMMLKLICQHQDEKSQIRLAGQWVDIDPREWRNQFDVNINVGVGMGNKDQKVAHLLAMIGQQEKVFPLGVANPENIYQSSAELAKLLGYRNGDKFFSDPAQQPPQPPKPDPAQLKIQADQASDQARVQADIQKTQAQIQADKDRQEMEMQMRSQELAQQGQLRLQELQLEANKQELQAKNDMLERQHKAELDAQLAQQRIEYDKWAKEGDWRNSLMIAELSSKTTLVNPLIQAAIQAESSESRPMP
jgi:hypothetical protein